MNGVTIFDRLTGSLMRKYRNSSLHSQRTGTFLAKILALFVRFRRTKLVVKEINGVKFELDLNQVIDSSLFFSGTFEEAEEIIIGEMLSPGMVGLDIGANFGYHTFAMARLVAPNGHIYALEPTSWAYDKMLSNAVLNPDIKNITLFKIGLSDEDAGAKEMTFQSSYLLVGKPADIREGIALARLDTVINENQIHRLDFIKMDVDGYEAKVIGGAINTLRTLKPQILMEISPDAINKNGGGLEEMVNTLSLLNYQFTTTHKKPIMNLCRFCSEIPKDSSAMIVAINS